jgi:hypothetical protein
MKNRIKFIISASFVTFCFNAQAKENTGVPIKPSTAVDNRSIMAGCSPATAQTDLDINNVRARIMTGGDMWWDLIGSPRYYIPKPEKAGDPGPSSLFAGSLWIGGIDAGGQLKIAAMTYRQTGNDFWPGPLSSTATIDAATCLTWDKFYKINRADVEAYYNWLVVGGGSGPNPVSASAMDVINTWPALGPEGQPLAPYNDYDVNGFYDPSLGDYPDFDITGTKGCNAQLFGDQCIYYVFNDKGNTHSETGGQAIGLEIQAEAFAFQTSDEINNMTFYKYKIVNKSSFRMDSTFFGVWDDPDLGYYLDDYVGCDVDLGLGIVYNADDLDGSGQVTAYGANPPAVGVDFFEGPFADSNNVDDASGIKPPSFLFYGDTKVDNERLGIGKFIYYNNDYTVQGNPTLAVHFYQYLTGMWKDATPFTYGGDAHLGSTPCNYVFPGSSDPNGYGVGGTVASPISMPPWSAAGTAAGDKRFLESAGPFTLKPGAVNTITIGVPWARATQGGALASVALLKGADAKAQQLFNNCFSTLDGPTAPNLAIQEMDKELILTWSNPKGSNNFEEKYFEDYDKSNGSDSAYRFQGYQIYQLKDGTVGQTELYNVDKARLVFQCDKEDAVSQIVNYGNDPLLSALVPQEKVNGANKGVVHSVSVTTDKFATGDDHLINHKTYYYAIVAYGFSPTQIPADLNKLLDYNPFIAGRKFSDAAFFHTAIPHITSPEAGGTENHSVYGSGPKLTRIEGRGNGGLVLDMTDASEAEIVASTTGRSLHPVYQGGRGPITIKVIDPLNVPDADFEFTLNDKAKNTINDTARWTLKNLTTGEVVNSESSIKLPNEQLINGQPSGNTSLTIPKWGISVSATFAYDPGPITTVPLVFPTNNGFLEATMTFSDNTKQWLTGVADIDGINQNNWIRSGAAKDAANPQYDDYVAFQNRDEVQAFEKVLGGMWAPYCLAGWTQPGAGFPFKGGPAWNNSITNTQNKMKNLSSVDVIITSDRSKWTRCPVLELEEDSVLAIGKALKLNMRRAPSVDKNGDATPGPDNNDFAEGMGWFPGYAINLETGERLNMAFGEDSWLANDNGADMKWNPSAVKFSNLGSDPVFGGKHYIYVFGHNGDQRFASTDAYTPIRDSLKEMPRYDGGKAAHFMLEAERIMKNGNYKRGVFKDAMWVNIPLLAAGHSLMESDVKIRLRVTRSYQKYGTGTYVPSTQILTKGETYLLENGSINYGSPTAVLYNSTASVTSLSFTADSANTTYSVIGTSNPTKPSVVTTVNRGNPMYTFNTADLETHKNDAVTAKDALALINIVPNPYYAYSSYEKAALDNVVKITNLPAKCTISIYTLNGTLIRKFKVDQSGVPTLSNGIALTSIDWDLKNTAKIPVASGLYIIHVDVPGVGERILKWFGVMRPQDLEAY